ncbi:MULTISPECIES: TetR family transcriptional regulator [Vibrio]|uniref:Uncharacterized protein n=1 Tax=Vibrio halioticoli NBRC 102217 TaxID=1219072 RepID=V5F4Q2_9VIBR|nr:MULTISPECIES: TetR family transcriptional regulator [Vibrio]MPW36412.1 TetR family transcriptional regulator [Vibrio sp. B1Z05]GAD90314.1 hypothetical protein VHA01S_039_00340 [Vibrio halioticoli NBRC 102217]
MPKRSKEDTEITVNMIMDSVLEQMLTIGYDQMSYTTLSRATGVSRTGISHHFPKKADFALKSQNRVFDLLLTHLDFDSGLTGFSKSWQASLQSSQFLAILRLMIHHITVFDGAKAFSLQGIDRLFALLQEQYGEESKKELEWLLGLAVIRLVN